MIEIILLIIGLIAGAIAGYFMGKSKAFQSADLSQQTSTITGLTTQITEMKIKFDEIEKSRERVEKEREKTEKEKEKRLKELMESNNKFFKEMSDGSKKSDEEKEKRIKEIIDANKKFFDEQKQGTEKFLTNQGKTREETEKQRDAQVNDMKKMIQRFIETVSGTKKRGMIGESILGEVLQNSIRAGVVKKELKIGSSNVEFAWDLRDGKYIPIDSKLPEIFSLVEQYDITEDIEEQKSIAKKIRDKVAKEVLNIKKYQNQTNTIDNCILVVPPAVLEIAPQLVAVGQENNVFICSYRDVFPIAHVLDEQYQRFKEEGDIGEYKNMVKALFNILDNVMGKTETIDRAIKQISNANGDIKDEIAKGKRL